MLLVIGAYVSSAEHRVQLNLVDVGDDPCRVDDPIHVRWLEIRRADRPDSAVAKKVDETFPRVHVAIFRRIRPVDKKEIYVLDTEPIRGVGPRLFDLAHAMPPEVELRRDEDLFAIDPTRLDACTYPNLVAVLLSGVKEPVADMNRLGDVFGRLLVIHWPRTEADAWHRGSVCQGDFVLERRTHGRFLLFLNWSYLVLRRTVARADRKWTRMEITGLRVGDRPAQRPYMNARNVTRCSIAWLGGRDLRATRGDSTGPGTCLLYTSPSPRDRQK